MIKFIQFVNELNMWIGKAFAWCVLILTFGTSYEVFMRYVMRNPTNWAFDMSYIMYGTLFMMAGAYTLSRDGHVRGDVFYRLWKPATQAKVELVLYFVFFFPGRAALVYAGVDYAAESWSYMPFGPGGRQGEISINSPAGVPVSPLKSILPFAAALLILQGIAEVCRCIICIRTGAWPAREQDIKELEEVLLEQARRQEQELEHKLHIDERDDGARIGEPR